MAKKLLFLCFLLFAPNIIFGQLADFSLTATATDETCLGNGTLTFETTGTTAGSVVTYYVYELPDVTNPIAVQTSNFLDGRTSGTYQITAVQVLGAEQNSQTITITINNSIVPLSYFITSTNALCNDGTMMITITSGIGSQYEIISGPVIRPLQPSPLFTMLPSGIYEVRVFDNCGDATVITHTLSSSASNITIGEVSFPSAQLPTCNSIMVSNVLNVEANQAINYPLQLTYTVHFPDGTTQTVLNTITNGLVTGQAAITEIPFFYDQLYTYDLTVTDECNNTFSLNNNIVNQKLSAMLISNDAECGAYYLTVDAFIYSPDIQIQFTDSPAGFDPSSFNINHPGPYNGLSVDYGSYFVPVPFGHYAIQLSDGCGHSAEAEITLVEVPAVPIFVAEPLPGCQSNISNVTILIPRFTIVTAVIIVAPSAYGTVPDDVSDQITTEGLELNNLITGNYTVVLTDECGNEYIYDFFVQDVATTVSYGARPGCELGKGSLRIRGNNTMLTSVILTSAPASFPQPLPYNASSFIGADGGFSMANLLPGSYSFTVLDNCGIENTATIDVIGYAITSNNFTVTPHCGAFDINVNHVSNAVIEVFWLQKFDPITNTWGNPVDGTPYIDGTNPSPVNSYLIQNNTTTLNLTFLGNFRIIKSFQSFDDGNISPFKTCIEIINEFEFNGQIQFTGIEKVNCNGEYMDVKLFAIGVPPLHYSIILKNGIPFFVDNGNSNVFTNLEPAVYTFQVDQSCGDSRNFISDVAQLPSLAIANQPNDMIACDDVSNDGMESFVLTDQNATVLGTYDPTLYTITYHLSMEDAATNSNPLPSIYNSGNKIIYCRLKYTNSTDCYDVVSFNLVVNPYFVNPPINISLCENQSTTLMPDSGFISYNWSTGETTQSITVSQSGQYILDVVQLFPTGTCGGQYIYNVTTVSPPIIDHLDIVDWTDTDNSITVFLENNEAGNYEYSLDGINYQESNLFTNLTYGYYTVYVRDSNCGADSENALVLNYPKYFTPNGDGYNDYWKVKFSEFEPNMKTYIFDRFGKLLTGFTSESLGWDGTLNGRQLPSTDYWFVVVREDGRNLRGHFAMKR